MKHMADLDLEGTLIQIYPGDSVKKWGKILHVTAEGVMIKVTKVEKGSWSSADGWEAGTVQFLSWGKLSFKICESEVVQ